MNTIADLFLAFLPSACFAAGLFNLLFLANSKDKTCPRICGEVLIMRSVCGGLVAFALLLATGAVTSFFASVVYSLLLMLTPMVVLFLWERCFALLLKAIRMADDLLWRRHALYAEHHNCPDCRFDPETGRRVPRSGGDGVC